MSEFPKLQTKAAIQYPSNREISFSTQIARFVDGSEQRYKSWTDQGIRWIVRLDLLTDAEVAALRVFHEAQQGQFGSFSFTDPWTSVVYPDCSFGEDEFAFELKDESRAQVQLTIVANRK